MQSLNSLIVSNKRVPYGVKNFGKSEVISVGFEINITTEVQTILLLNPGK